MSLADDILAELEDYSHHQGASEAAVHLETKYAGQGIDPLQAGLARLLSHAARQAQLQIQLNADRDRLHSGRLRHDELVELGHHYETLRHAACEYNHQLRGFIEAHHGQFSRGELTGWLTTASGGHGRWAEGEVTGCLSEIALHAALNGLPELRGVRYATLEEDLKGYDFMATWQGAPLSIDAKTGRYAPINEHLRGHRHLEIYVPREAVRGLQVTRPGLDGLRHEVRAALHQDAGVRVHGSHQPFLAIS